MENGRIIRGRQFTANGFDVKVALKTGFENKHQTIAIEIDAEHLTTKVKSHYSIPFYNLEIAKGQFFKELDRAKNYYSAPFVGNVKVY